DVCSSDLPSKTANSAIAAASLRRASPSTKRVKRAGAPISRKIAMTAAGSVVDTTEPSSKQTTNETRPNGQSAKPTTAVEINVATIASSRIGAVSSSIRLTSVAIPASNTSKGRKTEIKVPELTGRSTKTSASASASPDQPRGVTSAGNPPKARPT